MATSTEAKPCINILMEWIQLAVGIPNKGRHIYIYYILCSLVHAISMEIYLSIFLGIFLGDTIVVTTNSGWFQAPHRLRWGGRGRGMGWDRKKKRRTCQAGGMGWCWWWYGGGFLKWRICNTRGFNWFRMIWGTPISGTMIDYAANTSSESW